MYLRPCKRKKDGKVHTYWKLVESYRTERGPRQRVVAYLGLMEEAQRLGVRQAAEGGPAIYQPDLFGISVQPEWVEIDASRMRVERCLEFGGPWLVLKVLQALRLNALLDRVIPEDRADVEWSKMALVLIIARLCDPSSELRIAEHFYRNSGLCNLLGIPDDKVNDDRLYRALDKVLPHKEALEIHLKERLGELFQLEYELLLYDVTSTYFEGLANGNAQAQRGYSRDQRPDCKQVCIALVVTKSGMPLAYEVFDGNRADVSTVEEVVNAVETRYGQADRIWVMDRGMVSEENIEFLQQGGRRYILGTPKSRLKGFQSELLKDDWEHVREGVEVKLCPSPEGQETFILCRSAARRLKEQAIHGRFYKRLEDGLRNLEESCRRRKYQTGTIERRVGRLLGQNSRAAAAFKVEVRQGPTGSAEVLWSRVEAWIDWASLSDGCYLLRSNINDWSAEELWRAYIQLTEAESAFRIHKQDLKLRPIWHQKEERVQAHILVCFLAYVVWKTLAQWCRTAGLGDEPRRVLDELSHIRLIDIAVPTRNGPELRRRLIQHPTNEQAVLLQRLGLQLPKSFEKMEM